MVYLKLLFSWSNSLNVFFCCNYHCLKFLFLVRCWSRIKFAPLWWLYQNYTTFTNAHKVNGTRILNVYWDTLTCLPCSISTKTSSFVCDIFAQKSLSLPELLQLIWFWFLSWVCIGYNFMQGFNRVTFAKHAFFSSRFYRNIFCLNTLFRHDN